MDRTAQNQTKTLYLLRHAKSAWDNPNLSDFDRPLNKRGKENLPGLANIAAILNPPPELIVTSPSRRTLDTVNGFCRGMSTQFSIEGEKKSFRKVKKFFSLNKFTKIDFKDNYKVYPIQSKENLYHLFFVRYQLHRRIYHHKTVKAIEIKFI